MDPMSPPTNPNLLEEPTGDEDSLHSEADSEEKTESETEIGWKEGDLTNEEEQNEDVPLSIQAALVEVHTSTTPTSNNENPLGEIFSLLIPCELSAKIFHHLDLPSKRSARLVSPQWTFLVDPLLRWKVILGEGSSWSPFLSFLSTPKPLYSLHLVGGLGGVSYPEEGLKLSPPLRELHLLPPNKPDGVGISEDNLRKLLQDTGPHLERLFCHSGAFRELPSSSLLRTMGFPALAKLQLDCFNKDVGGYYAFGELLVSQTFPSLRSFSLSLSYEREAIFLQMPPFYKELFQFLSRHGGSLAEVSLGYHNLSEESTLPPFVFDMDSGISGREYLETSRALQSLHNKLSHFSYEPTFYEGRSRFHFGIQLLSHQTNLHTLILKNIGRLNFGVWEAALGALAACAGTLRKVHLFGCFCPESRPLEQFSCSSLGPMLEDFQIGICGLKIVDVESLPPHLRVLLLGKGLSSGEIGWVVGNLGKLEEWYLPQDRAQFDRTIPKTSVTLFKAALKGLPKLRKLVLNKRCASWKRIRKGRWWCNRTSLSCIRLLYPVISYTQGLVLGEKDGCIVEVLIQRERVELDRL